VWKVTLNRIESDNFVASKDKFFCWELIGQSQLKDGEMFVVINETGLSNELLLVGCKLSGELKSSKAFVRCFALFFVSSLPGLIYEDRKQKHRYKE